MSEEMKGKWDMRDLGKLGGAGQAERTTGTFDEPKGPRGVWLSSKHGGRRQKIGPEK